MLVRRSLLLPQQGVDPLPLPLGSMSIWLESLSVPSNRVEPLQPATCCLVDDNCLTFSTLKPGRTSATSRASPSSNRPATFSTLKPGRTSSTAPPALSSSPYPHFPYPQPRRTPSPPPTLSPPSPLS